MISRERVDSYLFRTQPVPDDYSGLDMDAHTDCLVNHSATFNPKGIAARTQKMLKLAGNRFMALAEADPYRERTYATRKVAAALAVTAIAIGGSLFIGPRIAAEEQKDLDKLEQKQENCLEAIPEGLPAEVEASQEEACNNIGIPE